MPSMPLIRAFCYLCSLVIWFLSTTVASAQPRVGVVVAWDRSGSMYRLRGVVQLERQDYERLNQAVLSILFDGNPSTVCNRERGDAILQNDLKGALVTEGDRVDFLYFGELSRLEPGPSPLTRQSFAASLPDPSQPSKYYVHQRTYYRKALVTAFDAALRLPAERRYVLSITDEVDSEISREPDVERRHEQAIETYPLLFSMLLKRNVQIRVYALQPLIPPSRTPTLSPTASLTPTATIPPTTTLKPTQTPTDLPTKTPTPTITPVPVDPNKIALLKQSGKPVDRITFESKPPKARSKYPYRWSFPEGLFVSADKITATIGEEPVTIIKGEKDEQWFEVKSEVFNRRGNHILQFSIPYTARSGEHKDHNLTIPCELNRGLIGSLVFFIILSGVLIVGVLTALKSYLVVEVSIQSSIPRVIDEQKILRAHQSVRFGTPKSGEGVEIGNPQEQLTFDGSRLVFENFRTAKELVIPFDEPTVIELQDKISGPIRVTIKVHKRRVWPLLTTKDIQPGGSV